MKHTRRKNGGEAGLVLRSSKSGAGHALRSSKSGAGFTLLEVLVAMTILAILGAALFTMFTQASGTWQLADARTQQFAAARETLGMIAMELRQAIVAPKAAAPYGAHFYGIEKGDNQFQRKDVQADSGQVYFVAPTETRDESATQDLSMIGYWVNADGELMRYCLSDNKKSEWRTFKPNSNDATNQELGLNVKSLQFEFWNPSNPGWKNAASDWNSESAGYQEAAVPQAVRITLVIRDPNDPTNEKKGKRDKTFMTVVRLDAAE